MYKHAHLKVGPLYKGHAETMKIVLYKEVKLYMKVLKNAMHFGRVGAIPLVVDNELVLYI